MQKVLNTGVEFIELIPGASIKVTAAGGGGSYSIVSLSGKEGVVSFSSASTEKTGSVIAGPFSNTATLRIETKGRAYCSVLQPEVGPLVSGVSIKDVIYDASSRVISYTRDGAVFTITYPTATTAVVSNSLGESRTVTFDGAGRVTSLI